MRSVVDRNVVMWRMTVCRVYKTHTQHNKHTNAILCHYIHIIYQNIRTDT